MSNPVSDLWAFLTADTGDFNALGVWKYLILLVFYLLMIVSVVLLVVNWREDPGQRTGLNLWLWATRVAIGCMWFQGTLWNASTTPTRRASKVCHLPPRKTSNQALKSIAAAAISKPLVAYYRVSSLGGDQRSRHQQQARHSEENRGQQMVEEARPMPNHHRLDNFDCRRNHQQPLERLSPSRSPCRASNRARSPGTCQSLASSIGH